ncbi:MAG: serine hydrolase domain-containing protein [Caldilineaceae bacterium]
MDPQALQSFHTKIEELMHETGTPGVAVGILHNGEEHLAGFGVTHIHNPLPVDGDTLFQIGSTSKTVTATAAMRLVEAGKLDLDKPIRHYLPNFRMQDRQAAEQATLRHCFTHTGGWLGDYFDDTGDGDDALARYVERMADLPQQAPLGALWSYNNAGFSLAGLVIEAVAGKPFEQVVQETVLTPIGMDHSYYFARDVMTKRFAAGHTLNPTDPEKKTTIAEPWPLARSAHPAGGVTSSARDQLRYARFHMGDGQSADGNRLLSEATMKLMQTPLAKAGSMAEDVGVSWLLSRAGGVRTVAHGGATNGQMSAFLMVPERNFAITVLTNANRGRELHSRLVPWALNHFLGLADPEPTLQSRTSEELQPYNGRYLAHMTHLEVSSEVDHLRVVVTPQGGFPYKDSPPAPAPPPMSFYFVGDDNLLITDGPQKGGHVEVVRNSEGQVAWLRVGGRVHRKV